MNSDPFFQYYPAAYETSELMAWLRHYGLYRSEFEDFKEEMVRLRALKGKNKGYKMTQQPKGGYSIEQRLAMQEGGEASKE